MLDGISMSEATTYRGHPHDSLVLQTEMTAERLDAALPWLTRAYLARIEKRIRWSSAAKTLSPRTRYLLVGYVVFGQLAALCVYASLRTTGLLLWG